MSRFARLDALFAPSQHRAMALPRIGISLALACCVVACSVAACGDRPDLPGPATSNGSARSNVNAGGATEQIAAPVMPAPAPPREVEPAAVAAAPIDAGARPEVPSEGEGVVQAAPEPVASEGPTVAACTRTRLGCVTLYISVADPDAHSCLQLTLDDCGETTRPGLQVSLPIAWRLGSGFVGELGDACVPGTQFDVNNFTIGSGSGSIRWNQDTRQPSEIVIDVTLQPLGTGNPGESIRVTNGDLVDALLECAS